MRAKLEMTSVGGRQQIVVEQVRAGEAGGAGEGGTGHQADQIHAVSTAAPGALYARYVAVWGRSVGEGRPRRRQDRPPRPSPDPVQPERGGLAGGLLPAESDSDRVAVRF